LKLLDLEFANSIQLAESSRSIAQNADIILGEGRMSAEPAQIIRPNSQTFQLVIKRFAPWKTFGGGFDGDNRTFSTSREATYRAGVFINFDLNTGRIVGQPSANSSGSSHLLSSKDYDLSGNVVGKKLVYAKVEIGLEDVKGRAGAIHFRVSFEGSNPLVPGSPNIDTQMFLGAFMQPDGLFVTGLLSGDPFPNAEVFLRDNGGNGHLLLTYSTPYDKNIGPGQRLWGSSDKNVVGSFQVTIPLNASWQFKYKKQSGHVLNHMAPVPRRVV
jgi:hypothetical protein